MDPKWPSEENWWGVVNIDWSNSLASLALVDHLTNQPLVCELCSEPVHRKS